MPNPVFGTITTGPLALATAPQAHFLKPYPQYSGVTRLAPAFGNSHYHSAQFTLEKRTSNGVTAQISYTIAKNLSDLTNADNAYNRQAERSYASFDVPQRLSVTSSYDLPFGRGRSFGRNISRPLD